MYVVCIYTHIHILCIYINIYIYTPGLFESSCAFQHPVHPQMSINGRAHSLSQRQLNLDPCGKNTPQTWRFPKSRRYP